MDLCFEPTEGDQFTMEIGYFDSVLEIKEKVQKYQGILVSKQNLIFNGQVLPDDLNVHFSDILDQSSIQLLTENNSENVTNNTQKEPFPVAKKTLKIRLKFPTSIATIFEMHPNDTVHHIKQLIHEAQGIPINRLAIHTEGFELHDDCLLRDYNKHSKDILEFEITMRPSPTSSLSTDTASSTKKKLRLVMLIKKGNKKIAADVNATDKVGFLRKELINLHPQIQFTLPNEGYFFLHNQKAMDEDRSFSWHQVNPGDTIEVVGGTITGDLNMVKKKHQNHC